MRWVRRSPERLVAAVLAAVLLLVVVAPARAGDYAGWAAMVVAGDWRSHSGGDTDAFDNARRDVAKALVAAGFDPKHVSQLSLRPPRPGDGGDVAVDPRAMVTALQATAAKAPDGCVFYLTSHGSPEGAVLGPAMLLTPYKLGALLDAACPARPTVVIISACFSGVFATPTADAPERMVMTASRADRSSFGCGDKDKYPYFDACVLQSLPQASDFVKLSILTRACVDKREAEENLEPRSEPQTWIGPQARVLLPLQRFDRR